MTDNLTNYIQFAGDKLTGNIATLAFDVDVTGEALHSENEKAPKFRLFAKSPAGRRIDIGVRGVGSGWGRNDTLRVCLDGPEIFAG
ncbi:DUF736 family protein [Roseibium aggregatum]|uniref:DUF736 family protein n=1 Tax=Roseibium aggregatum TaxID=187304 RepID=UPI001E657147|nr:DUF736 family protein [Roseibium aggregatum]UES42127.1 DUF736 family protein [Roseibium aggregatum]